MSIRSIPILLALGLMLDAGPANAKVNEAEKPRRPVTGEPTWTLPVESKEALKQKERAAKRYIEGLREVEKARGGMYREKQLKLMAVKDPESGKKAIRMKAYAQEHLGHALKKFEKSVELDPKVADSWSMLGYTLLKTGKVDAAVEALEKALALKPAHLGARENMAEAHLARGQIQEARAELDWLKKRGNMATLETKLLQEAINEWTAENRNVEPKQGSGQI